MMPLTMKDNLKRVIVDHEDRKKFPYVDTKGNITIGIGYNLTGRGMPDQWIDEQYDNDVNNLYNQLSQDFSWYDALCEPRKIVLIDMCFMGYEKFKKFHNMINALSIGDYKTAADEMINSEWANDVGARRSGYDHNVMITGVL